jgi:ABC-type dipeptide/oligopeptide/nickel transport system permease subunit
MIDRIAELTEVHSKKRETPFQKFLSQFLRNIPSMIGLVVLVIMLGLCMAAPLLTHYDPQKQDISNALQQSGEGHLLGTDYLGRDIMTRLLYGGRLTMTIGFLAVGLGLLFGVTIGCISGYYGGWFDTLIQRLTDILLAFPSFLLALTLVAMLGIGVKNVIISVGVLAIPSFIRLVRGSVLSQRETLYVDAARCIGASDSHIIFKHILPNAMAPVIINASLNLGYAITTAAGLGFLGLGVPPSISEWGMMLGEAKNYIFSHPYMLIYPGVAIFITIISLNLIGDGLRDALDPRSRYL